MIFKNNKYTRIYDALMNKSINENRKKKRKTDDGYVYYESHHIIPKSIAPEKRNDTNNCVLLTAREHFIAHCLLVKILVDPVHVRKMKWALVNLTAGTKTKNRYFNSKLYALLKEGLTQEFTKQHCENISKSKLGSKRTLTSRLKQSETLRRNGIFNCDNAKAIEKWRGSQHTVAAKKKISEARKRDWDSLSEIDRQSRIEKTAIKNRGKVWWTDGNRTVKSMESPGDMFVRGRIMKT